jgi:Ni/Fe-hydrogenase 1 B-type cytochrome subunit
MSHKLTRLEHPWPAVLMHGAHLLSFFVLIATGLAIHAHSNAIGTMQFVRQTHSIAQFVFILTTVARIYWAFFGAGSAAIGSLVRHRDWRFFGLSGADFKALPGWVAYYLFLRKTHPHAIKYNPLQKLTYLILFPLGILVMALSGFAMFAPSADAMAWFANIFGGLNGVRLMHYLTMWIMIAFFMIHLYLVIVEDPAELSVMLARSVPQDLRVPGDYSEAPTEKSAPAQQKA